MKEKDLYKQPYLQAGNCNLACEVTLKTFRITETPVGMVSESGVPLETCSPESAMELFRAIWKTSLDQHRESIVCLAVNARNRPTAYLAWTGAIDHSVCYPRNILELCIRAGASGFILAHNHPSGDCVPSSQDLSLTKNLEIASKAMGIRFLDHVIIDLTSPSGSYSFQRSGLLS